MTLNSATNALFSRKPVILGLALVFLALALSCGFAQSADHPKPAEGIACNRTVQLVNYIPTKDGLSLGILFLSLIGFAFLIKRIIDNRHSPITNLSFSFIKTKIKESQFLAKLYNPILEALRKGILNPQIYNLAVIR